MVYRMVPVSMTSNPGFQGQDIIQRQITQKRYKIEQYLQWRTNKKSYMVYRTAPFSMTLNDPYHRFQSHAIFNAKYVRNGTRYRHIYSSDGILV